MSMTTGHLVPWRCGTHGVKAIFGEENLDKRDGTERYRILSREEGGQLVSDDEEPGEKSQALVKLGDKSMVSQELTMRDLGQQLAWQHYQVLQQCDRKGQVGATQNSREAVDAPLQRLALEAGPSQQPSQEVAMRDSQTYEQQQSSVSVTFNSQHSTCAPVSACLHGRNRPSPLTSSLDLGLYASWRMAR